MGKYYDITVSEEEDSVELYTEELTFHDLQCWIMDLIRLDTENTLQTIFSEWQIFDFTEDDDDEEGHIQFVWHEDWGSTKYYFYFVYADSAAEAESFLLKYLVKNGLPKENRR